MSVNSQLISTAQWYGRAGFPVFPIHWPEQDGCSCRKSDCPSHAKHPLTPHGFQDASQDRAMITEWWSRWPAANIGLTTGTPSGLLVVDIDPRNGGDRSLQTVIAKNGNLPATAQQFTGGGGRHFFFRYSGGRVPKTLAEGIDLKGDGGYVVIAPSRHCSGGHYRWAGEEGQESLLRLAEAPDWLQTFIATPKNDGPHREPKNADGKFGKGQRNNRLTSLAGTMQRCGMAPEAIETALLEENRQNCDPPLPDGEVRRIVASVGRYAPITVSVSVSSNDDWPEPASLKLELPPVEPFDLELLPRSLRPLVRDVSERMQAPADFMAAAAVVGLAASIGRRAFMQPKALDTTWRVVPNLWGAIVARPGFMKSPTIQAMMQPLRNIQANWFEENENAVAAFEREKERDALKISAWKESFKRATKAGAAAPERPEEIGPCPEPKRLIVGDATFEKLHEVMKSNPAGILVLRDELTGWLAQLDKSGRETERAFSLEAWNGDAAFTIDRVGRGLVHVNHVCMSLFGGIQPGRLHGYLADALKDGPGDDGLIQRFQVLVWPDLPVDFELVDRQPDDGAVALAQLVYSRLVELPCDAPATFTFAADAQELFGEWYPELQRSIRGESLAPALASHQSKYAKLMPALALVFELADQAAEGRWSSDQVGLDHTRQAAAFCEYLKSHAGRLYFSVISREMQSAAELGKHIRRAELGQNGAFSLRDVYRPQWAGLNTSELANSAIRVLIDCDWVRNLTPELDRHAGRPSTRFVINPRLRR